MTGVSRPAVEHRPAIHLVFNGSLADRLPHPSAEGPAISNPKALGFAPDTSVAELLGHAPGFVMNL
jgi:hypothetical protein